MFDQRQGHSDKVTFSIMVVSLSVKCVPKWYLGLCTINDNNNVLEKLTEMKLNHGFINSTKPHNRVTLKTLNNVRHPLI